MPSTEWKPTKAENPDFKSSTCGSQDILYRIVESFDGAHEDYNYKCQGCDRKWWVEGADY